jgi:acyl-CoA synthetase (AMP-forming)/AMP-acid ligase II
MPMVSSWGSTETAPVATSGHRIIDRAGVVGLPPPGVRLKFVPAGGKLEIRVHGPNVFPGYWRRPDLTRDAFDADGFYRIGDAARLLDPAIRPRASCSTAAWRRTSSWRAARGCTRAICAWRPLPPPRRFYRTRP